MSKVLVSLFALAISVAFVSGVFAKQQASSAPGATAPVSWTRRIKLLLAINSRHFIPKNFHLSSSQSFQIP